MIAFHIIMFLSKKVVCLLYKRNKSEYSSQSLSSSSSLKWFKNLPSQWKPKKDYKPSHSLKKKFIQPL